MCGVAELFYCTCINYGAVAIIQQKIHRLTLKKYRNCLRVACIVWNFLWSP